MARLPQTFLITGTINILLQTSTAVVSNINNSEKLNKKFDVR